MTTTPSNSAPKRPAAAKAEPKQPVAKAGTPKAPAKKSAEAKKPTTAKAQAAKAVDDATAKPTRPPLPPPTAKGAKEWAGNPYSKQSPRATTHHRLRASRGR